MEEASMSKWIPVRIPVAPGQQRCAPSGARCRVESVAMEGGSLVATLEGGSKWTAAVVERVFSMVERAVPECTPGNFVTVYPHGIGRDVERGEVITTRDLTAAHARVGAALKALTDSAEKAWEYANVRPALQGSALDKIQAYADMLSERCDARGHDPISDSVIEQLRALGGDHRAVYAPAPNAKCPRCGGPATPLLVSTTCERVGGCMTAEERVAREEATAGPCVIERVATRGIFGGEPYWQALVGGVSTYHPSRAAAVASWRGMALDMERRS